MSKKYYSGSDMYKNHRDMIAKILEQAEKMDEEHGSDCECEECMEGEEHMDESADHPEDCRCKMCKPSIYEGDDEESEEDEELEEDLKDYKDDYSDLDESADHPEDCRCKMCKPSIYEGEDEESEDEVDECNESEEMEESDEDFIEKAKKEIEDETDRAIEVAEENGQIFDNVSHMNWFVQAVADKIKEDSQLDEKDLTMGHISSKYDLKKHIANNFDHYKDNIMRLYPQDLKNTKEVFLRFLKDQELDKEKLNELSKTLAKKIREVGDAYDEMAQFVDMVIQVS